MRAYAQRTETILKSYLSTNGTTNFFFIDLLNAFWIIN